MQQNMQGSPNSVQPMLISNIPDLAKEWANSLLSLRLNTTMKYDDILMLGFNDVYDLHGKQLLSIKPQDAGADILVSSDNSKYAVIGYGNLMFSDNTTLSDLFNPHLVNTDGKIFLAYMYYSPKKNSILQCRLPY